ncbi:MAG: hypothetical protein QM270_01620 [Bacillota bacterium]|nr:hypothetical protein [Bacillota bacterium]
MPDGFEGQRLNLHGLFAAHGWNMELEAGRALFDRCSNRRRRSVSQSFVATQPPVSSALMESSRLSAEMSRRDQGMMAAGRSGIGYHPQLGDWPDPFFTAEPESTPEAIFRYETSVSNVPAGLAERLSRQDLVSLRGRLLHRPGFFEEAEMLRTAWGPPARARLQITEASQGYAGNQHMIGSGCQIWMMDKGFVLFRMGAQLAFCYLQRDLVICTNANMQPAAEGVPVSLQILHECFQAEAAEETDREEPDERTGAADGASCCRLIKAGWIEPHKLRFWIQSSDLHPGSLIWTLPFTDEHYSMHFQKRAEFFCADFAEVGWGHVGA